MSARTVSLARLLFGSLVLFGSLCQTRLAQADVPDVSAAPVFADADVLDGADEDKKKTNGVAIRSVRTRTSYIVQNGNGFQSQAGPSQGPGSERVFVVEPQAEVVITQGDRFTHRVWIPLDVVTAASPDAIDQRRRPDVISQASRVTLAGTLDWTGAYKVDRATEISTRSAFHIESNFRSWIAGVAVARAMAEDNTTLSASLNQVTDWFDIYDIDGNRKGHASRSSQNLNLGVTQLLSPTTVGHIGYGGTLQTGRLGNTWNSVPIGAGARGAEIIPDVRWRHALVGRIAQYLPWNAALKGYARLYVDDWGALAGTGEIALDQRLFRTVIVSATYRLHRQRGVSFFTTSANQEVGFRTSDSDLQTLTAQTIGGHLSFVIPGIQNPQLHADLGYDHYFRSNSLAIDMYSCGIGLAF